MHFLSNNKYKGLLSSIILLFAASSLFDQGSIPKAALTCSLILLMIFSVLVVSENIRKITGAFVLALPLFYILILGTLSENVVISPLYIVSGLFFFGFVIYVLIENVFTVKKITLDLIIGSICIYFLLCILWAFSYMLIESYFPNSFNISGEQLTFKQISDFTYYSIVTITTLGYGDILPLSHPARVLASLEAIAGQIYLTVLIARLIGIHLTQTRNS